MKQKTDTFSINEWVNEQDKKIRKTIDFHISQGLSNIDAVRLGIKNTTLGGHYISQIRHDYNISIFENL